MQPPCGQLIILKSYMEISGYDGPAVLAVVADPAFAPTDRPFAVALATQDDDLGAAVSRGAAAVVLSGDGGYAAVERLAARLAVAEAVAGAEAGRTGIVYAVNGPAGLLTLSGPAAAPARLVALGLDEAALAERVGVDPDGAAAPLVAARGLVVLAAAAAGVPAFRIGPAEGASDDGFQAVLSGSIPP